jgi:hypothetical protein
MGLSPDAGPDRFGAGRGADAGVMGLRNHWVSESDPNSMSSLTFRHYAECRNEGEGKSWYLSEDFTTMCQMS